MSIERNLEEDITLANEKGETDEYEVDILVSDALSESDQKAIHPFFLQE